MNQSANILFKIYTPYNDVFLVNDKGQISKPQNVGTYYGFSDTWKIQGIENVKSNQYIPFEKITKDQIEGMAMLYKNGNPKFTVRDLDHGTTRVWGNTTVHGIKQISFNV